MDENETVHQLAVLCRRFGASPGNEVNMAKNLIVRSRQLAEARSISEVEAMQYLLSLLQKGAEATDPPQASSYEG